MLSKHANESKMTSALVNEVIVQLEAIRNLGKEIGNAQKLCNERSLLTISRPVATLHLQYYHVSTKGMFFGCTSSDCLLVRDHGHKTYHRASLEVVCQSGRVPSFSQCIQASYHSSQIMRQCCQSQSQRYFRASRTKSSW